MKKIFSLSLLFFGFLPALFSQKQNNKPPDLPAPPSAKETEALVRKLNIDSAVTVKNAITIKGQRVSYTVIAGTIPVWDENGKPLAGVFYTYYERSGWRSVIQVRGYFK